MSVSDDLSGSRPVCANTPDGIAARRLLDRAQMLEDAGYPDGAAALRRRAAELTGTGT